MFKFAAGTVVGWIAARSLEPAPLAAPTLEELVLLAVQSQESYDKAVRKLREISKYEKYSNENSK